MPLRVVARFLSRTAAASWKSGLSSALSDVPTGTEWLAVSIPLGVWRQGFDTGKAKLDKKTPLATFWRLFGRVGGEAVYLTLLKGEAGQGWVGWVRKTSLAGAIKNGAKLFPPLDPRLYHGLLEGYTSVSPRPKYLPWLGGDVTEATLERVPSSGGTDLDPYLPTPETETKPEVVPRRGTPAKIPVTELKPGMVLDYNSWFRGTSLEMPYHFGPSVVTAVTPVGKHSVRVQWEPNYIGPESLMPRVNARDGVRLSLDAMVNVLL